MTAMLGEVLADLEAESGQVDHLVVDLSAGRWSTPTPAAGWTIAHQIAHLAWTDDIAIIAATDPFAFRRVVEDAMADPLGHTDRMAAEGAATQPAYLLRRWQDGRHRLAETLRVLPQGTKIPWFGPSMSGTTMATARLMETWAHGHDVAEALNIDVVPNDRVRHVCHLAVRSRSFAYHVRGLTPPSDDFRVDLIGPSGSTWSWGPVDSQQHVTGAAWDFALLATRRRHRRDVDVTAVGEQAEKWLEVIQAFAGPSGADPVPLADR
ncbi:MAG: TIGR03084 family metal-binding protein [Nocardioidaceae bacterium]